MYVCTVCVSVCGSDTLSDDGKQVWQLSELPELPPMLEDEQDLKYFATLL